MSAGGAGPPGDARRILAAILPASERHSVLDELAELYEARCARLGRREANRWYRRQVASFAWQLARHGRRRGVEEGRTGFQRTMTRRGGGGDMFGTTMIREVGHAARRLVRAPVFTAVAVLTIGLGVGAFASIFSLVDAVLLEPMPYRSPDELGWVWRDYVEAEFPRGWLGGSDVLGMQERPEVFTEVVPIQTGGANLSTGAPGADPQRIVVHYVGAGLFDVLGVPLLLGREPTAAEDVPGGPAVAVVSYAVWRDRLGADPDVIGRSIDLSGTTTEVIGVAPADLHFVKHGSLVDPVEADVYLPLQVDLSQTSPGSGSYAALVRFAADLPSDRLASAFEGAATATNAFMTQYDASPVRLWASDLTEDLVAPVRPALVALMGSAAFLLLVLAANLTTLLLGRATTRRQELGIRAALGAGRRSLGWSVLTESGLLALMGGALAVAVTFVGTRILVSLAPEDIPRIAAVSVDGSVLLVAVALTVLLAAVTGCIPAALALGPDIGASLGEGGSRAGRGRSSTRARNALVTTQVALSVVLLVGAALTGRAFARLLDADPGFDPSGTLTFGVPLPGSVYGPAERLAFDAELRTRIAALPGVRHVGGSSALPLSAATDQRDVSFPGAPGNTGDDDADSPLIDQFVVTPSYFEAAGHRLLAGRGFDASDADSSSVRVVIDDVLADRFFPGVTPVGRPIAILGDTATIVGVVVQAHLYSVQSSDRGQVYLPFQRFPNTGLSYAVRSAIGAGDQVGPIRSLLNELDASVPLSNVLTLEDIVDGSLAEQRLSLTLMATFAFGALVLAVLGIYGVVSNAVTKRRQEIGVRMALGAGGDSVVRLVLGQGVGLATVGAAVGLVIAALGARFVEGVMFGVDTSDPWVYGGAAGVLVSVALLASWLPARRATRIEPVEALRP